MVFNADAFSYSIPAPHRDRLQNKDRRDVRIAPLLRLMF